MRLKASELSTRKFLFWKVHFNGLSTFHGGRLMESSNPLRLKAFSQLSKIRRSIITDLESRKDENDVLHEV